MATTILKTEIRETSQTINENGLRMVIEKIDVNDVTESATAQFYTKVGGSDIPVGSAYYAGRKFNLGNITTDSPMKDMWDMILSAPIIQPLPESEQE